MTLPDAPRTRDEQFAFLRDAHAGPDVWHNLCQSLARQAPGLPAVARSALAAAHMVHPEDRIHQVSRLRRGMVLFFDDPNDDNPFAHVVTLAGWQTSQPTSDLNDLLCWSPDTHAVTPGSVDLVSAGFFRPNWGDPMLWGAVTLNGFYLPGYGPDQAPHPVQKAQTYAETLDDAIRAVRRGIRTQRARKHPRKVAQLNQDLQELIQSRELIGGSA